MSQNPNTVPEADPLELLMSSASAGHDLTEVAFEFSPKPILFQPVTVLQCVGLVKEFRGLSQLFEPKVDKSGKPLPKEMQPNLISIFVDAGKEAVASFVACGVRREGDEIFKKWFASSPDKVTLPMFKEAVKVTLGDGDLDDFFMKVLVALAEAKIIVLPSDQHAGKAA